MDWVLSHQANRRILDAARDRLGVTEDKFPVNVDMLGNTSSASVPTLLDECNRKGMFKPGDKLLLVAFGGGLTWAAAAIEWV